MVPGAMKEFVKLTPLLFFVGHLVMGYSFFPLWILTTAAVPFLLYINVFMKTSHLFRVNIPVLLLAPAMGLLVMVFSSDTISFQIFFSVAGGMVALYNMILVTAEWSGRQGLLAIIAALPMVSLKRALAMAYVLVRDARHNGNAVWERYCRSRSGPVRCFFGVSYYILTARIPRIARTSRKAVERITRAYNPSVMSIQGTAIDMVIAIVLDILLIFNIAFQNGVL